jgi:elongation factor Tu
MTVEDVFIIRGRGTVVTGRVASGTLHLGDQIVVHRGNTTRKAVVTAIEMFHKMLDQAKAGDIVGVLFKDLTGDDIQRGDELEA